MLKHAQNVDVYRDGCQESSQEVKPRNGRILLHKGHKSRPLKGTRAKLKTRNTSLIHIFTFSDWNTVSRWSINGFLFAHKKVKRAFCNYHHNHRPGLRQAGSWYHSSIHRLYVFFIFAQWLEAEAACPDDILRSTVQYGCKYLYQITWQIHSKFVERHLSPTHKC